MLQPDIFETNNGTQIEKFLQTFTPLEETILRFKFGISCKQLNDVQIVNEVSQYKRYFRMTDLKRLYKTFNVMVLSRERCEFQIFFDFNKPCLVFGNAETRLEYEAFQLIYELELIANAH